MIRTPNDAIKIKQHVLDNGLRVLLVQDNTVSQSAMALGLNCGNLEDPTGLPGLFHLLEHCLFSGSKHYPGHNSFNQWLDEHHGHVNAWTAPDSSCYFFDAPNTHFMEAVPRFVDMLVQPSFPQSGIDKEIAAIESEFRAKSKDEQRRLLEVQKETCNQAHPFSRFSVGNRSVFSHFSTQELREALVGLHQRFFNSAYCNVVIIVPELADTDWHYICGQLGQMPQGEAFAKPSVPKLHKTEHLRRLIRVNTQRKHHRLILSFSVPSTHAHFRSKPDTLVSHLLGYESKGGLIHYLKRCDWATNLIAGGGLQVGSEQHFNVNIQLTPLGMENLPKVLGALFYYVDLIKNADDLAWRFEEKSTLNSIAFKHQNKQSPSTLAQHLAIQIQHYPVEYVLFGEYVMDQYNPDLIKQFACALEPENLRAFLLSGSVGTSGPGYKTSKFYQAVYKVEPLPKVDREDYSDLEVALSLPPPNQYIPDFDVTQPAADNGSPKQILPNSGHHIWIGSETKLAKSKGECFVSFSNTATTSSLLKVAQRKLWTSLMQEKLVENFYPAQLAGLHFNVYAHQNGIGVHTSGFAERQLALLQQIMQTLGQQCNEPALFTLHKENHLTALHSRVINKPLNRLFSALQALLVPASYMPEDLLAETTQLQREHLDDMYREEIQNSRIEALLYGSWRESELASFCGNFQLPKVNAGATTVNSILLTKDIAENCLPISSNHPDAALVFYLQAPSLEQAHKAHLMLFESLVSGFYFNWMRNQKQLGYMVGTGYMPFNAHPGVVLYIQSPHAEVGVLEHESRQCLHAFASWLHQFSPEQWESCKNNLVRQLLNDNVGFSVMCQRYWGAIGERDSHFDGQHRLAEAVRGSSSHDIVQLAHRLSSDSSQQFVVYSSGKLADPSAEHLKPLGNIYQYK